MAFHRDAWQAGRMNDGEFLRRRGMGGTREQGGAGHARYTGWAGSVIGRLAEALALGDGSMGRSPSVINSIYIYIYIHTYTHMHAHQLGMCVALILHAFFLHLQYICINISHASHN
jgi:hypothetical protein